MYDYVIIHGSYGNQFENWFPWLYQKLTEVGKEVLVPQFPSGKGVQTFENWARVLDAYKDFISDKTTFICHSLGPAFIVDYLLERGIKANNLYLFAPFYDRINIPDFDEVNIPFFIESATELSRIESLTNNSYCYVSTTDPYVPNQLSFDFAKLIGASVRIVDNAGHFNKAAGYSEFEMLFETLMSDG